MARRKSLIVLIAAPVTLLLIQILIFQIVVAIEGPTDPNRPVLTPLTVVAVGVSTALTAVLMTFMVARMAKVPWRSVFSHRRAFDWRRLTGYLLGSAVLVSIALLATGLIAPEFTGWGPESFGIGATTVVMVLVTLLATPLQAAGEEVVFRGAVIPAAGSWFRNTRLAVVVGILVSGALFSLVHVSLEPWFVSYLFVFSACTAIMGMISGGLEAAMALHVSNNVLAGIVGALFAGGATAELDRSAGSGSPAFLILMVMNVAVVVMVWLVERRKRSRAAVSRR